MPIYWVEVQNVEWASGHRDGERYIRVAMSNGRRRIDVVLDARVAEGLAKSLRTAVKWCAEGKI